MLRHHVKDLLDLIKKPKVPVSDTHNKRIILFTPKNYLSVSKVFLFYNLLQSEASNKAVFAKVMVITSKNISCELLTYTNNLMLVSKLVGE